MSPDGETPLSREIGSLWRKIRSNMLLVSAIVALGATAWCDLQWSAAVRDNAIIHDLRHGRDIDVGPDVRAEILLARLAFLSKRDELERARGVSDALDRQGDRPLSAEGHYLLANAQLRKAFDAIERGDLDAAGPLVNLAKRDYRRALQLSPDHWDAKFNLDVAARLVRDYPEFERKGGDDLYADPKKLWTDIPGAPKGLP